MATHSSVLAWRIPWTEEPGRSMGSQSWTQLKQLSMRADLKPLFALLSYYCLPLESVFTVKVSHTHRVE